MLAVCCGPSPSNPSAVSLQTTSWAVNSISYHSVPWLADNTGLQNLSCLCAQTARKVSKEGRGPCAGTMGTMTPAPCAQSRDKSPDVAVTVRRALPQGWAKLPFLPWDCLASLLSLLPNSPGCFPEKLPNNTLPQKALSQALLGRCNLRQGPHHGALNERT